MSSLRNIWSLFACLLGVLLPHVASAQSRDLTKLALEDLLETEVISSASKFQQLVREAPASITIVTADDIRRYGHRTLADVLRSVRGLYTSYDRNYSYLGIRGFALPGDYNTRVLLLVDGNRLNDGVYDMAPIGTEFPIDLSVVDRVEVIRGPGSSLYGTSAFFAVINVVTRTGAQKDGWQLESYGGSLSTRGAVASFGHVFSNHSELLASVSAHRSAGARRLYFPEFDTGDPGSGVVRDRDDDETATAFVSLAVGRFTLRGGVAGRLKQVPTAAFGTILGDDRADTEDRRRFVNATYGGPIGGGFDATARVAYDSYHYVGSYPYGGDTPYLWKDGAAMHALAGELTVTRRLARRHNVTAGIELRRFLRNQQWAGDESGRALDVNVGGTVLGLYAQDEARVARWLLVNAGARVDRHPTFGARLTPRAGLVLLPRPQTSIKLLRGHAFRAPNSYELHYYEAMREERHPLTPEQFKATEIVWEEQLSKQVRATVSWHTFDAYDLVEQRSASEVGDSLYFVNGGHVEGAGIEAELDVRLASGVRARYSQSYADVHNRLNVEHPPNSPRHLAKIGVEAPIGRGLTGALEAQYVGTRTTLDRSRLPAFVTPNLVLTSAVERRIGFTLGVYNLTNTSYGDPGAEEHAQRSIPQNGRTALARLRVGF